MGRGTGEADPGQVPLLSTSQIIKLFYRMGLLLLAPAGGRL